MNTFQCNNIIVQTRDQTSAIKTKRTSSKILASHPHSVDSLIRSWELLTFQCVQQRLMLLQSFLTSSTTKEEDNGEFFTSLALPNHPWLRSGFFFLIGISKLITDRSYRYHQQITSNQSHMLPLPIEQTQKPNLYTTSIPLRAIASHANAHT